MHMSTLTKTTMNLAADMPWDRVFSFLSPTSERYTLRALVLANHALTEPALNQIHSIFYCFVPVDSDDDDDALKDRADDIFFFLRHPKHIPRIRHVYFEEDTFRIYNSWRAAGSLEVSAAIAILKTVKNITSLHACHLLATDFPKKLRECIVNLNPKHLSTCYSVRQYEDIPYTLAPFQSLRTLFISAYTCNDIPVLVRFHLSLHSFSHS